MCVCVKCYCTLILCVYAGVCLLTAAIHLILHLIFHRTLTNQSPVTMWVPLCVRGGRGTGILTQWEAVKCARQAWCTAR